MDLDDVSGMPEWEDDRFRMQDADSGETWKQDAKYAKAARLYNQWKSVLLLLLGLYDSLQEDEALPDKDFIESEKAAMLEDAYLVGAKIRGAEGGDQYVLRMENAAMIRKSAQTVYIHVSSLAVLGLAEEAHIEAVRAEIEKFRAYFKDWVASFERDEFEDEWGLFL
ncbi:MAG TPA: hypothetical protein VMI35_11255 [Puia sp.]|nr:hypothetical protein [Puia sp.]